VPAGSARLRVTLTAAHSEAQVQRLLEALVECFAQLGPEPSHA
jgi:8-amino-7-oxononanoate synthase